MNLVRGYKNVSLLYMLCTVTEVRLSYCCMLLLVSEVLRCLVSSTVHLSTLPIERNIVGNLILST